MSQCIDDSDENDNATNSESDWSTGENKRAARAARFFRTTAWNYHIRASDNNLSKQL